MHIKHQNLHRDLVERAPAPALTTVNGVVMSVVYVTAEPTFTGVIGGYSTVDDNSAASATRTSSRPRSTALSSSQQLPSSSSVPSQQPFTFPSSTGNTPIATGLSPSTAAYSPTNTGVFGAGETDPASSSTSSDGMSVGAKIGLGAGIICGIGAVAAILLLLLAKKKRKQEQRAQALSEKREASNRPATAETPKAPRLSLRPVSGLAEFMGNAQRKNRTSQGNMLNTVNEVGGNKGYNLASMAPTGRGPSSERPTGDNPFRDPENPFADPEKAMGVHTAMNNAPVSPITPPATAMPVSPETHRDQRVSGPTAESFPLPQSQAQPQMTRQNPGSGPAPLIIPSTATHHELPASAPSPVVARGPGPGPGPEGQQGNVYRILMDFRPTMDDELELRSGQLVRMLHEYDDGWALCIRLDRSQQGVVPRTCLAAKPSKPRPGPPPSGPNARPITPQGRPRGPPGGVRSPQSAQGPVPVRVQDPSPVHPNTGAFNQPPRPLSPGPRPQPALQKRSVSPESDGADAPQAVETAEQKQRSNSVGTMNNQEPKSPPATSHLGPGAPPARSNSPGLAM